MRSGPRHGVPVRLTEQEPTDGELRLPVLRPARLEVATPAHGQVRGRTQPSCAVLTHGEPHPGYTVLTSAGWLLIDWDTALVAPPERDLWGLEPGDGSVLDAYASATGVTPLPALLEFYRIRWDLADIAVSAAS